MNQLIKDRNFYSLIFCLRRRSMIIIKKRSNHHQFNVLSHLHEIQSSRKHMRIECVEGMEINNIIGLIYKYKGILNRRLWKSVLTSKRKRVIAVRQGNSIYSYEKGTKKLYVCVCVCL